MLVISLQSLTLFRMGEDVARRQNEGTESLHPDCAWAEAPSVSFQGLELSNQTPKNTQTPKKCFVGDKSEI